MADIFTPADRLTPDDKNFNQGSDKGRKLIRKSVDKFGPARSGVIDKNGNIIAGNKAFEAFKDGGGYKVAVHKARKDVFHMVQMDDLDLNSPEGRELALADNQTSEVDYVPDVPLILTTCQEMAVDAVAWGVPTEDKDDASQVSFTAKKKYSIRIEFPYKGKLKQAEKIITKLIKEQFPEASVTVKMG